MVDASNVIGSRPDGWWKDRVGAQRRFLDAISTAACEQHSDWLWATVTVVFDGPAGFDAEAEGVVVEVAPRRGPDAADDRIVDLVLAAPTPADLVVVTSDRALSGRVIAAGASVRPVSWLRSRLPAW